MIEHGRTPVLDQTRLAALGFSLILYPLAGLYASAHALTVIYRHLRAEGTSTGAGDALMTFDQFNDLIGVDRQRARAARWSGSS